MTPRSAALTLAAAPLPMMRTSQTPFKHPRSGRWGRAGVIAGLR